MIKLLCANGPDYALGLADDNNVYAVTPEGSQLALRAGPGFDYDAYAKSAWRWNMVRVLGPDLQPYPEIVGHTLPTLHQVISKGEPVYCLGQGTANTNPNRDERGRFTTASGLVVAEDAPPTDKPLTLVFGGSFNPVHSGHVEAALKAKADLERAGYKVGKVVLAPSGQKLLQAKLGPDAYSVDDRAAMLKLATLGHPELEASSAPGHEADSFVGKLKRTQLADWAKRTHPDTTVVAVTGEDAAPGHPPGPSALYQGDKGTSHEGYYYLNIPRESAGDTRSSSEIRKALKGGQPSPSYVHPAVAEYLKKLTTNYDPSQQRDQLGRFKGGGAGTDYRSTSERFPPIRQDAKDSVSRYTDAAGKWTPERQALHTQIIHRFMDGKTPVEHPVAYIMGGGTASGKSSIIEAGHLALPDNTVRIDPDAVKDELPDYVDMKKRGDKSAAAFNHGESSHISRRLAGIASRGGYNVLWDGTGDSNLRTLSEKVAALRQGGQLVVANYVTVDTDEAVNRANLRAQRTGRVVPESEIRRIHQSVSQVVPQAIKAGLFDEFTLWDNNGPKPVKVASAVGRNLQVHDTKLWKRFLDKGAG